MDLLRNAEAAGSRLRTASGLWRCAAVLLMVVCAGCSIGPNYHPPQAIVPDAFPSTIATIAPPPGSSDPALEHELTRWWTQFHDPLLDRLIDQAITGNLDLQRAEYRILQARAGVGIARSAFFPQINYANQFTRSRNPVQDSHGHVMGVLGSAFRQGFDSAWELDIFGGTRRAVEASKAQLQASVEDRRNLLVILVAEVGADYIAYRGAQREIVIARQNLDLQNKNADITQQRFHGGFVTGLDVANADALMAATRSQIPVLETIAQQQSYNIAVLLGREPGAVDEDLKAGAPIPPPPPTIPVGLPSELLRRRPDIRSAEALVHAATAQIGVAESDLFPKFSLTGSTGLEGTKLPSLVHLANRFWNIGPSVQWQAFAGGRISSNIKLQKALQQEACLAYQQTVLVALQDVDNTLVALAKEKERRQSLQEAVAANLKAVDLSTQLYSQGKTDFLNVINAQRSLYEAEDAVVQSDRNISTDVVSLYKALGGGWDEMAEIIEDSSSCVKCAP